MAKSLNIPLEEEMVSILGQCGSALTNVLQSKFGCTTVLHGVDATCAGQSRKPSVFPEERFSTHLSKSFKVSVWKDDLTTHRVDAVVNAANNRLKHCGGLTKALSDAGGPAIQQDIDQYIFRQGKLSIGDAIIAPPGYLPCRNIIHAVGPNLPYNNRKYEVDNVTPQLQRAVLSILKVVKQDNLQSVAIPAVSSGLFNYPLPLCADVIVKTLKEYHDSNYSGAPLEVRLVNHDEPSVREMARACRQILGSSGSHSQPVEAQGQPPKLGNVIALDHPGELLQTSDVQKCFFCCCWGKQSHLMTYLIFMQKSRCFKDGRAGVIIQGSSRGVRASVLELEAIFCKVQEDFATKEESDMGLKSSNNFPRTPVENNSSDDFSGLEIVRVCVNKINYRFNIKGAICDIYRMITDQIWLNLMLQVEKVENSTLKHLFEIKKRQLYQRLPVQYCDLVSRVGFQREFAPPDGREATYSLEIELHFLITRLFEANVQTGKSTIGTPGLIVPPETPGGDPLILYDSVEGGVDTCVIFNGHQALPEYLIIYMHLSDTLKYGDGSENQSVSAVTTICLMQRDISPLHRVDCGMLSRSSSMTCSPTQQLATANYVIQVGKSTHFLYR
uniref:Protein mono-ADP-ribosyltransferase PARP9 n=1 Tax=Oncorhynchus kisutch TaxID=8019 RepID=A0A8C7MPN4_ONCKI